MELSILQHAKDKAPRQVTLDAVVEQIRGDQWPAGYSPCLLIQGVYEGGRLQKQLTRMSGLSVVVFDYGSEKIKVKSDKLRQQAVDDEHTLVCYQADDRLVIIYRYELDRGYDISQQRSFYKKAFLFGNDYYKQLLDQECVRDKDAGRLVPMCHDPDVYYNPQAEEFLAWEIKEGCRQQTSKPKSTEGLRERKPSWAEQVMTLDEIDDYLKKHAEFRRNVITGRIEIQLFSDRIIRGEEPWEPITDWHFNNLWRGMKRQKFVSEKDIHNEIESEFSPDYHPFRDYLKLLPPWDENDYIRVLAASVTVAGDFDDQQVFYKCLKKWLVGMIAGWLSKDVVNQTMLVFVGPQGCGKTTWFNMLLPPELLQYFYTRPNISRSDKDTHAMMTQFGLVCCEELDRLNPAQMNTLKADITTAFFNDRPPYGRYTEYRKHIASFCGTGNNVRFLNDPTGTRRWLPFKVESILSPREFPFEYEGIYAQAYALYLTGFEYYFTEQEIEWLNERNRRFQVANLELQLVHRHFRKPSGTEPTELIDVVAALDAFPHSLLAKITPERVDAAFAALGYEETTVDGITGYLAVHRKSEEIQALGRLMALDATKQQST